ncbi:SDR family NAD(P)-dependent oxidoreductase [Streptomyces sp. NPDC049627]|uniref:SDR family NAD(P)-dependent oxidoreductase n=1 Tax=Streptomyces sp. NPDC049627 TaxID=3365595 RepID=UPI0037A7BFD0
MPSASTSQPQEPATDLRTASDAAADVLEFPATYAQQGLWFFYRLNPHSAFYNVSMVHRLNGELDTAVLRLALNDVVRRHEALRTTFREHDGELRQVVADAVDIALDVHEAAGSAADGTAPHEVPAVREQLTRLIQAPFDLENGPLLRATLVRTAPADHLFVLSMHHIVVDGWSLGIFLRELGEAYRARRAGEAPQLPELAIQYGDYAEWQAEQLRGQALQDGLEYWRTRLSGDLPELRLATDRPRPETRSFAGARFDFTFDEELTARLKEMCRAAGVTLYMALFAGVSALLHRYTGQDDFILGTPMAGRDDAQTQPLIGSFVNTLPMRADLSGDPSFTRLLGRVREMSQGAYAHDDIPFEKIVEDVAPQRGIGANPLFQVTFALQNYELGGFELAGVRAERIAVEEGTARFDLEVHCWDDPHRLRGSFVYSTDLFDRATMERMAAHLTKVFEGALADPSRTVGELSLLTEEDRRVVDAVAGSDAAFDAEATVPRLFAAQVAARPGATAVRAPGADLSYAELGARVSTLAARLRGAGLTPGTRTGLHLAGPVDELVGTLAVLAAGGVCVPLNPSDDPALLGRSARRTGLSLLLTRGEAGDWAAGLAALDLDAADLDTVDAGSVASDAGPDTAQPAGPPVGSAPALLLDLPGGPFVLDHAGLADRLIRLAGLSALTTGDLVARQAAQGQERAVWEALLPVCHGASLVAADGAGPPEDATVVITADSDLSRLLAADAPAVSPRALLCLTSVPSPALARRCHDRFGSAARWVYVTPHAGPAGVAEAAPADAAVLFTPLRAVRVLDGHGAAVPVGVPAEVQAGGPGVALPAAGDGPVARAVGRDIGRITPDGKVEILGRSPGTAVVCGVPVDIAEVTTAILAESAIADVAVVERRTTAGHTELVAYAVRRGHVPSHRVVQAARAALPSGAALAAVVFVTALPRTSGGRVDTAALSELPVLDDELAAAWEQALSERDVPAVVVVAESDPAPATDDVVDPRALARDTAAENAPTDDAGTAGYPDVPAISSGGPALDPGAANLAEVLRRAATDPACGDIVYVSPEGEEDHQTYGELRDEASRVLGGLRALGARPGDKVILQLADNRDFVTALWACVLGGFVAVPLAVSPTYAEDTAATNKLVGAWTLLSEPLLLTDRTLADPLRGLMDRLGRQQLRLAVLDDLRDAPRATDCHDSQADDLVLLLLTSGSTGRPKAVELRHRNILARTVAAQHVYELTRQDVSFNWMPLDHVGGIVMSHIRDVYVGCRQIQAPTQWVLADPLRWTAKMAEHRVTTTWAPNFAFGLIAERAGRLAGQDWDLSALRLIINGGEAIVPRVTRRFMEALAPLGLPATAMRPAWGMSETSSGEVDDRFDLETSADDDQFVCVGAPFPGFTMRIVDGEDTVVREGVPGRLQVKGPAVTSGYHLNPEQNAESFTEDGWFETGDLAVLRDGRLTITGRAKDAIIINGHNFHSHELEECVEELDEVERSFTAACAVRTADSATDELALFFSLKDGVAEAEAISRIRAKLLREAGAHASYLVPTTRDRIPKTEIGKIQRTLLRRQFEAGEFAAELRRTGAGTDDDTTLPNWFHRPVWRRAAVGPRPVAPAVGHTLLVADGHGLADALAGLLRDRGERCTVLPADTVHSPQTHGVDRVVHLAGYAPYQELPTRTEELAAAYREGPLALAELLGAVVRANPEGRPVALTVVATHSQWVREGDRVVPERGACAGVVKSAGQEYDWLRATHLDVEPLEPAELAHRILELLDAAGNEPEQALRAGERWVRRIERLPAAPSATAGFRRGELVVVSGGLGGLAAETAAHLLSVHGVRLLLLGRTALPAEEAWDEVLAAGGTTAERIAVLRRLRALGEVHYAAADVTDEKAVRAAVQDAEERFAARAATVVHLAGHFHEAPVTEAGEDDWSEVTRAKVLGAAVLHHLVKDRPEARFLSYSSVNGFFGGANVAGYAAANAFLDALAVHQSTTHGIRAQSLGWTMWDELGLSRGYALKALTEARGYRVLAPGQAVSSLDVALRHATPHVLIGLDHTAPWVAGRLLTPTAPLHRLVGYRTAGSADDGRGAPGLPDRYGTRTDCEFALVAELPVTESGEVDRRRLAEAGGAGASTAAADDRPNSAAEQAIAAIWCDLLGLQEVGVHDNFFDIGGHSLRAAMLLSRLRAELGVDLTIASLFENPTIAGLVRHLDPGAAAQDPLAVVLPLRREGDASPLFCLHPGGGISWCYSGLLGGLPDRHPVYGIQARGLNGEGPLPATLDEMVEDYLAQVREIQPVGPYHFLGWSFGGVIAHAMATRLTAEGHRVGVLAMIDAWPADPELDPEFGDDLNVEKEMLGALLADAGYEGPVGDDLTRARALQILRSEGSPLGNLTEESITSLVAIATNNIQLRAGELRPYDGDLLLFHAAGDDRDADAVTRSWRRFSTGRIDNRPMPYGHNSIIHPKPLAEIGAAVGERMVNG